jgi:hypothetical protein
MMSYPRTIFEFETRKYLFALRKVSKMLKCLNATYVLFSVTSKIEILIIGCCELSK